VFFSNSSFFYPQPHITRRYSQVLFLATEAICRNTLSTVQRFWYNLAGGGVRRKYEGHYIISIVKPTRCTSVSNLFHFGMTLYMFRTVFPPIIRSSKLYILQPNRQQYLFVKCHGCCSMYSLELLMMDGKTVRNM